MPVWVTFLLSLIATAGFFGFLYALICFVVASRRRGAMPRLGIQTGESETSLNVWAKWNAGICAIGVYRFRFSYASPTELSKEGQFSITFDPPQKGPFVQPCQLPEELLAMLRSGAKGILTVELKTVERFCIMANYTFEKIRSAQKGNMKAAPPISNILKTVALDPPAVSSLEWTELQERKKKVKDLEAQAKAKAEKAAQAVAAAKTATGVQAPKLAVTPSPAPKPSPEQIIPPQDQPVVTGVKPVLKT